MVGLSAENQLRDVYNMKVVASLAGRIKKAYPEFDEEGFSKTIANSLEPLGFGERSALICSSLKEFLPADFSRAARILINSLEPELEADPGETIWERFIIVPETEFIRDMGMENFELSMEALYEMTKRFSSEGAIRAFIERYPEQSLALLKEWTKDGNVHVRRLVSEGSRPRLPLSAPLRAFKRNPKPVLELLEMLKDDPELYVRRSVANNLNDISKDNPDIVIETVERWKIVTTKERKQLINHALRTLFKQGNQKALALMGFLSPEISSVELTLERSEVSGNSDLRFTVSFLSVKRQKLMVDYCVHYVKSNGKHAGKVFKLSTKGVARNEQVELSKTHSFKAMTTRKHYDGEHFIEIIVNGVAFTKKAFHFRQEVG